MKKVLILLLISVFLFGCTKEETTEYKTYNSYIEELDKVKESSESIPFDIKININELENNILSYTALVNRNDLVMKDIETILIHNKESSNVFPSIGIYDDKITLDNSSKELGIKLTGYLEKTDNIDFKFFIKYKNEDNKELKYYYVYNYRQ